MCFGRVQRLALPHALGRSLEIFIVVVLNTLDQTRMPFWVDADDEKSARRKALKFAGDGPFRISDLKNLGDIVLSPVLRSKPKKTRTKKTSKKRPR